MDLVSHTAVGVGIATIATSKPEIAQSEHFPMFVLLMILAANLPDLDGVFRIFGNKTFLKVHRGFSHSVFISLTTSIILGWGVSHLIPDISQSLIIGLTMMATSTHILTDLTNNYGIQIGWPLNKIWFRLSITNTADTLILVSHAIGLSIVWILYSQGIAYWLVFVIIYVLTLGYWVILFHVKNIAVSRVKEKYAKHKIERVYVASRSEAWNWKYICKAKNKTFIGYVSRGKVQEIREVKKGLSLDKKTEEMLMKNSDYKSFTNFSPIYKIQMNHVKGNKVYYLKDLRYFDKCGRFFFTLNVSVKKNAVLDTSLTWTKDKDKRINLICGK